MCVYYYSILQMRKMRLGVSAPFQMLEMREIRETRTLLWVHYSHILSTFFRVGVLKCSFIYKTMVIINIRYLGQLLMSLHWGGEGLPTLCQFPKCSGNLSGTWPPELYAWGYIANKKQTWDSSSCDPKSCVVLTAHLAFLCPDNENNNHWFLCTV